MPSQLTSVNCYLRGYLLQKEDLQYINLHLANDDFESYKIWDRLKSRELIQKAYEKDGFLFILESAKQNQIIGSKLANWITFGNNAIQFYSQNRHYPIHCSSLLL